MKNIAVKHGQTLLDIALEYCGDITAVFQILELNNVSITDEFSAEMTLIVPEAENNRVVSYYVDNAIKPATETNEPQTIGMTTNDEQHNLVTNNEQYQIITNNV